MEQESSLPCSQKSVIGPCLDANESTPQCFLWSILISYFQLSIRLPNDLFHEVYVTEMLNSCACHMHVHLIVYTFIFWSFNLCTFPVTHVYSFYLRGLPITVAARSTAWTLFARSNAEIVGSNPTQGMDVCVSLFCVCVVRCVGRGLATGWSPIIGALLTVYRIKKLKKRPRPNKGL
jgi:hypothetical protein